MTKLVFDNSLKGHHMEYLHHLYMYAAENATCGDRYVFVLPESFVEEGRKFSWPESSNISFDYLSAAETGKCDGSNLVLTAWHKCRILRKYAKKHKADSVFLIMIALFMPFLGIMLPGKTKARGIIYRIYLYEWQRMGWSKRIQDVLKFWLLARSSSIDKVFILNDEASANYLNRRFKTGKFAYLPDPVSPSDSEPENLREELGIKANQQLNIHFGGLSKRKGTLTILDAIALMDNEEIQGQVFVFAGRVYADLKDEFYEKCQQLISKGCDIRVYDEFCSYEFINSLCHSCDKILIPYLNTTQSSGVIGYAALHGKPVIGPSGGLLGKLIRNHSLGNTLEVIDAQSLKKSILAQSEKPVGESYMKNTPELFAKICLNEG